MIGRNTGTRGGARAGSRTVRERILDAALRTLAESGIQQLTQVEVARRAGVRQSHLTYYFPTRDDLLEAVTARAVDEMTASLDRAAGADRSDRGAALQRLAATVTHPAHTRLFVAMIVEADGDPAVRRAMRAATRRMEAAVAGLLDAEPQSERAGLVLAALWGLGLYQFLMRPAAQEDLNRRYLSWLAGAAAGDRAGRARKGEVHS